MLIVLSGGVGRWQAVGGDLTPGGQSNVMSLQMIIISTHN